MKSQSSTASVSHPASRHSALPSSHGCAGLDVVGLGYCSWDYLGILDEVPTFDAPTMSLHDFATSGGGPVSTALVTLARLGAHTGYVGAIGDDDTGLNLRHAFEQEGINISRLRVRAGTRSPVCICLVQAQTGKRIILCYRGTSGEVDLEAADRRYLTAARVLHLDGHHMSAAITAAQWMHETVAPTPVSPQATATVSPQATVVLDANRPRLRLDELLPWVDVLITNSHFPAAYTGESVLERAARKLLSPRRGRLSSRATASYLSLGGIATPSRRRLGGTGPWLVVCTLGEQGCLYVTAETESHVPGFEVSVVDTTGAGDAFHGGFIYGLLQDWPLERTATFANAVAAMNCTALGGRGRLPRLHEVEEFLRRTGRNPASSV
jgi:sulfofructose kinase